MKSCQGSYGVMAITLDFESNNPSSNLGRTSYFCGKISSIKFKIFRDMFNKVTNFLKIFTQTSICIYTHIRICIAALCLFETLNLV